MGGCNCSLRSTFHVDAKILDGLSAHPEVTAAKRRSHLNREGVLGGSRPARECRRLHRCITSDLPVIRPESGPDEPESKLKIDSWESWTLRLASNGQTGQ